MPTYSKKDFELIAAAVNKDVAHIIRYEKHFEAAAMWYWLDRQGSNIRRAPSVIKDRMDKIASAARRLLKWLDIDHRDNYRYAADGPRDFTLLEFLASAEEGNEDEVTRATARVGQLVEISTPPMPHKNLSILRARLLRMPCK